MKEELVTMREDGKSNTLYDEAVLYVATMCTSLMDEHCFEAEQWDSCFVPYIGPFVGDLSAAACLCAFLLLCFFICFLPSFVFCFLPSCFLPCIRARCAPR